MDDEEQVRKDRQVVVEVDWARILRLSDAMGEEMARALEREGQKGAKRIEITMAIMVTQMLVTHSLLGKTEDRALAAKEFRSEANWFAAEWAAGEIPIKVVPNKEAA
jgi:hypothetical protein